MSGGREALGRARGFAASRMAEKKWNRSLGALGSPRHAGRGGRPQSSDGPRLLLEDLAPQSRASNSCAQEPLETA